MTRESSRTVANTIVAVATVVGAFFLMRDPVLRRRAMRALKTGVTTTIPGYIVGEARRAWRETGTRAA